MADSIPVEPCASLTGQPISLTQGGSFTTRMWILIGVGPLSFIIGLVVAIGCMLGGFAAMGGHLDVLWQPFEMIIIGGSALGTFIVANPVATTSRTPARQSLKPLWVNIPISAIISTCWVSCTR
jgi:hypothetical protein